MPPVKYTATIVPNVIRKGDKIQVRGILMDDAKEFSINFVNELCKNPDFITYHFKWLLEEKLIVQDYKDHGSWIDHMVEEYDSLNGSMFELEFAFQDTSIDVYKLYENSPNHITTYEPFFDISDIKALQVWGDVKKVTEVKFKYS